MSITKLITAIILIESGGDHNKIGDNGLSVGALQIQEEVIIDVNGIYDLHYTWPDDAFNLETSKDIFQIYTRYWGQQKFGRLPTAEEAARIWNGGPDGNKKLTTLKYWDKVRALLK